MTLPAAPPSGFPIFSGAEKRTMPAVGFEEEKQAVHHLFHE